MKNIKIKMPNKEVMLRNLFDVGIKEDYFDTATEHYIFLAPLLFELVEKSLGAATSSYERQCAPHDVISYITRLATAIATEISIMRVCNK